MKRSSYGERDYAFGQLMLTLRTNIGLTQAGLAERLGVSRRAVAEWEAGSNYPKTEHLKQLISVCLQLQVFPAGREAQEIRTLWKAANQKVLLDELWLQGLLSIPHPRLALVTPGSVEEPRSGEVPAVQPAPGRRVDWGEALAVPSFYDRELEMATLSQWMVQERCRVVSVLGMGGIGKSALGASAWRRSLATRHSGSISTRGRDARCESFRGDALLWTGWSTDRIERLAFAPDGRTLASGSADTTVKLWDVGEEGSLRETLTGHTNLVNGVAWSPDGRLLASCGLDKTIWLWDVERSSYRTALHGHTAFVADIVFTPDSRSLLSGSDDDTLRVWDMERGQCVQIMQSYALSLYDIAWSHDGTQLASTDSDLLVTIWDVADRTPLRGLRGHSWNIYGVAWSPDDRLLASCGWDNVVRVWDASTGAINMGCRCGR